MAARRRAVRTPEEQELHRENLRRRGERVKEIRVSRGFGSQLQAASMTGAIDSGSLSQIERGEKDLELTTAERLADAFRVSLDTLVGRAPFDPLADKFPARQPILASPEFRDAPPAVQARFQQSPMGAETWSTLRWAREFFALMDTWSQFGALPPLASERDRIAPR